MAKPSSSSDNAESLSPAAIVEELDAVAERLAGAIRETPDDPTHETLAAYPEALSRVGSTVRGMADAFEAASVGAQSRREAELSFLLSSLNESLRELGEANRRMASKLGSEAHELDAIGKLPPDAEMSARLRQISATMHEAAVQLDGCLDSLATEVEATTKRIAVVQAQSATPAKADLYDKDTRLYNRAALDERLQFAVAMGPFRGPWGLLLSDIDRLEEINTTYGRIVGDALVFKISRIIEEELQARAPSAFLARHEGGTFAVILGGKPASVTDVADRLRQSVAAARWQYSGEQSKAVLQTTVSVGVTLYRRNDTAASVTERALRALRQAKDRGRNRVVTVSQ